MKDYIGIAVKHRVHKAKRKFKDILIEGHPDNYKGYPFVSLVVLQKMNQLVVIDNANKSGIRTYVIDLCGPANIDEGDFITLTKDWYDNHRSVPLSVYFSRNGVAANMFPIYREFSIHDIKQIIGPVFTFNMEQIQRTKKRRRKPVVDKDNIIYTNVFSS